MAKRFQTPTMFGLLFSLSLPVLLLVGVSIPVFCQGFVAWLGIRQFVVQEENAGEKQPCV